MDRNEIIEKLRSLIGGFLESRGYLLVDLAYRYEGRDIFLRILVDTPLGNISLGECAGLNSQIGSILDSENVIEGGYTLEISSPGLDRPLAGKFDFMRCRGRKIKVFLSELVCGKLEWDGIISKVEDEAIFIETGGNLLELPLGKINKAKQII